MCCLEVFCTNSSFDSMDCQKLMLWINFSENCFDFFKNLFNFLFDAIEKQCIINLRGSARGVIVIVVGNGHGDTSSSPGRD